MGFLLFVYYHILLCYCKKNTLRNSEAYFVVSNLCKKRANTALLSFLKQSFTYVSSLISKSSKALSFPFSYHRLKSKGYYHKSMFQEKKRLVFTQQHFVDSLFETIFWKCTLCHLWLFAHGAK